MEMVFKKGQIIICIGSGGVGKTTFSASLGAKAAEFGFKVLVLTIDPSKRLATTLGIEGSTDIVKVPGQNFAGELYASVVDHKKTFDDFIRKASANSEKVEKILNNKLYQQLTTSLSGSQDFTSIEKLYEAYESKEFDIIILDTPPAKHAIDFLQAPEKISSLFNEGIAKWFRQPKGSAKGFISALLSAGTKQVLKALEILTGNDFIHELSDFFVKIEGHQEKLQSRVLAAHQLLGSSQTHFCVVTAFDEAKLKEAEILAKQIKKSGYHLKYIVVNRAYPLWLKEIRNEKIQFQATNIELAQLYKKMSAFYIAKEKQIAAFIAKWPASLTVIQLPEFNTDIAHLKDLRWVMELIHARIEQKIEKK